MDCRGSMGEKLSFQLLGHLSKAVVFHPSPSSAAIPKTQSMLRESSYCGDTSDERHGNAADSRTGQTS